MEALNYLAKYERVVNGETLNHLPPQLTQAAAKEKFLWK